MENLDLYTIFERIGTPFRYIPLKWIHLLALLGLFTDGKTDFPTLLYASTGEIPTFHIPEAWKR